MGRRGGKSRIAAIIATYLALFFDYSDCLSKGERGSIVIVAADRSQARVIFNYISGALRQPLFQGKILKETQWRIQLTNNIDIEILTASHRTSRGRTVVAALLDEAAFFHSEGARPDIEIYRALKPSMATIPNALMVIISSPYAQSGLLYDIHKMFFGKDDPEVLVWQADTRTMNPTINQKLIDRELEVDRESAESEWYAQFRKDLSSFLSIEVIENCIIKRRFELPFVPNQHYQGFCDPSGGGGQDSMTLAIAHKDDDVLILDCIRAVRPPFDPYDVAKDFSDTLREYHITEVTGDKYAGEWFFSQHWY